MRSSSAKSGCLGGERADCDSGGTGGSDIPYRHDRQLLHNALEKAYKHWVNVAEIADQASGAMRPFPSPSPRRDEGTVRALF